MTDSQQNCFLAVAEHRSFSKAAETLYVSQPAVSKNISTLEAEMGVTLFDRQGKHVLLTKAGEIFLGFLEEYRREYENMLERIHSLDRSEPFGVIRIGCGHTWNAAHFYTRLSRHFAIHFPGVRIEVLGLEPDGFLQSLRRKEVDIAIMYGFELERHADIERRHLVDIGTGFLCSSLLFGSETNSTEILRRHPFIIAENPGDKRSGNIYQDILGKTLDEYAPDPRYIYSRNLSSALVDLSCGKGSLLVDDWTASISNSEYRYIPTNVSVPICLAYVGSGANALLNLVLDEAVKVFKGNY